ncbi:carbohydrate esterase family 3 protein [Dothistroma septosporum NZE10]|uniref:Carbohydrate esterase family 3 protein n=1 Tax=Dothistroma septosporum (strain NZE10 / CBS 128990) TaxID=675120 RepID=M2YIH9_DOTSN|nr:carbohydrate esterase family 3 protein [Dothistroma septosporum NZE10]
MSHGTLDPEKLEIGIHRTWLPSRLRPRRHLVILSFLPLAAVALLLLLMNRTRHTASPINAVQTGSAHHLQPIGGGVKLRIMALGDSITAGTVSRDESKSKRPAVHGYRQSLRDKIMATGVHSDDIDFIGSKSADDVLDMEHEGWPNEKIRKILGHVSKSKQLRNHPNLVLIHAGTNDMNDSPKEAPYTEAHLRLDTMLDEIFCQVPETVVVISKIIKNGWQQARTDQYNAKLTQLVIDRQQAGFKVLLADHSGIKPGPDKTHPSDAGYERMAKNWMKALKAIPKGWLDEPHPAVDITQTCHSTAKSPLNWHEELDT